MLLLSCFFAKTVIFIGKNVMIIGVVLFLLRKFLTVHGAVQRIFGGVTHGKVNKRRG